MKRSFLFAVVAAATCVMTVEARNRVIAYGWDILRSSPESFLENAEAWDAVPVDGVVFSLTVPNPSGGMFMPRYIPTDKGWTYEAFAPLVPVFRRLVAHKSFAHSLAGASFQKHKAKDRLDWRDDSAWANFAANMGVLARIVRESGLEGICIDNEDYGGCRQFFRKDGEPEYDELRSLARRRGSEVFGPVFREKPDIALLAFWFLSLNRAYLTADDLQAKERELGDLWPAFVEGMLEVMPDTATFHDGNEWAYYYKAETGDYFRSALCILTRFAELLEPQFRDKYRARVRASAGFYMDVYVEKNSSLYHYLPPTNGGTQVDRFCDNYVQADEACGGYIWFYGERHPWIDWKGKDKRPCWRAPTWNDAMPGLHDMLAARRDPVAFAARRFAEIDAAGVASNLFVNGSCAMSGGGENDFLKDKWAKGFSGWKGKKEKGTMGSDVGVGRGDSYSLRLDSVKDGCVFTHVLGLPPGASVLVRLYAKGESPSAIIYYSFKGKWRFSLGCANVAFEEPGADAWRAGYAVSTIPHGADGFGLQMSGSADGTVWYDDLSAYLMR